MGGLDANADDDNSSMFANGRIWLVEVQWYVLNPQRRSTSGDRVCYRGEKNKFPITVRSLISTAVASKACREEAKGSTFFRVGFLFNAYKFVNITRLFY